MSLHREASDKMGQLLSNVSRTFSKFFDYPVKRKPICFYRQEDFSPTGEARVQGLERRSVLSDYDQLVHMFYQRLTDQRKYNEDMKEKDRRWSIEKVIKRFPGWNEVTISNLHSLFLLFDNQDNGMLGFDDFCAILESLGDDNLLETRKEKFTEADTDHDGWVTYDDFLVTVYNFDPPNEDGSLAGLALRCNEIAENIQFVSNLTVGEQLEYGLF